MRGLLVLVSAMLAGSMAFSAAPEGAKKTEKSLVRGASAPAFTIKDRQGQTIDLAKLTAQGPVLVRLTCGCKGCDQELAYFQALHGAYKNQGLVSLAIFKEPDEKVEAYVKEKNLNMLYAVDPQGESWKIFQTTRMPANFLIEKGGKIAAIAEGCDPSGLLANRVSKQVAELLDAKPADVQKTVAAEKAGAGR